MMLRLTENAAAAIRGLTDAPGAEGVRISQADPSLATGGVGLQIELVGAAAPEDAVVEAEGFCIFLAPEAVDLMEGKVLDADVESEEVRFAVLTEPAPAGDADDAAPHRDNGGSPPRDRA